ncbi:hypothetical protein STEG23_028332, partial [Scotinomys teguina]
ISEELVACGERLAAGLEDLLNSLLKTSWIQLEKDPKLQLMEALHVSLWMPVKQWEDETTRYREEKAGLSHGSRKRSKEEKGEKDEEMEDKDVSLQYAIVASKLLE